MRLRQLEPMVTKTKQQVYEEFAKRLHEACDDAQIPRDRGRAKRVGALVDVGYKGAGKWLSAQGMPDMGHLANLAVELKVGFEWLGTGRGPKRIGEGVVADAALNMKNFTSAVEVFDALLPSGLYVLPSDAKAHIIAHLYRCVKEDGSMDMKRALTLVNEVKENYSGPEEAPPAKPKQSVRKGH